MPLTNVPAFPKHMFRVTVSLAGRDLGEWDALSSGGSESDPKMYRGGGSRLKRVVPGLNSPKKIKLSRGYHADRDDLVFLNNQCSKGVMTVRYQPLDADHNPHGRAITRTGVLSDVSDPESDVDSEDIATLELEFTPNEGVA